jgi:hypothetical protein
LKQQPKAVNPVPQEIFTEIPQPVIESASQLAAKLFPNNNRKINLFLNSLLDIYSAARGKDVLVIHSPGGWGNAHWDDLLDWEKSIVTGVTVTLEKLGYSVTMKQYFRACDPLWGGRSWFKEGQFFLFGTSRRVDVFADELKFITDHLPDLRVVMVGASQGAGFDNAVMVKLGSPDRFYSIELGTFFAQMQRRRLTTRNLAIDSNGLMSDPMCHRDLWKGTKAYFKAFVLWARYKAKGQSVKFTNCINTPGHEYPWEYQEVHGRIIEFLTAVFQDRN